VAFGTADRLGWRLVLGIRPQNSASGLGNSPSLRRRDMDKKMIVNDLRRIVDWRYKN